MDKITLEKNRLDLSYQRNLQLLNVVLLIGAGSFVTYLVALILDLSKMYSYTAVLVLIFLITATLYKRINANLRGISESILMLSK